MKVLIADDEKNIRDSIATFLSSENLEASVAADGTEAQALLESEAFDCLILYLRMPRMDGLALLGWLQEEGPPVPVIVISAYADVRDAVKAMKLGARDYLVKPFDPDELVMRIRRVLSESALAGQAEAGRRAVESGAWIGEDEKLKAVHALVEKVAATSSTVLITGESGTGKEVIARLLHAMSVNPDGPFVPINIGGIPEGLLESELFGHEKGAFTGAADRKRGMFELASAGTLFLDEIGDMPIHLQVKLLRVLQEKKVQRLGGTQPIPINARIVAATNRDLEALLKEGKFREDLYYRLNVIRIEVPPLRERRADIPALAGYFVEKFNRQLGRKVSGLAPEALARLSAYNFPGNIRELENVIERACILCSSDTIGPRDLGEPFSRAVRSPRTGKLRDQERELIEKTLSKHGGNRTHAAEELGISRRTLLNKLREAGIDE